MQPCNGNALLSACDNRTGLDSPKFYLLLPEVPREAADIWERPS